MVVGRSTTALYPEQFGLAGTTCGSSPSWGSTGRAGARGWCSLAAL